MLFRNAGIGLSIVFNKMILFAVIAGCCFSVYAQRVYIYFDNLEQRATDGQRIKVVRMEVKSGEDDDSASTSDMANKGDELKLLKRKCKKNKSRVVIPEKRARTKSSNSEESTNNLAAIWPGVINKILKASAENGKNSGDDWVSSVSLKEGEFSRSKSGEYGYVFVSKPLMGDDVLDMAQRQSVFLTPRQGVCNLCKVAFWDEDSKTIHIMKEGGESGDYQLCSVCIDRTFPNVSNFVPPCLFEPIVALDYIWEGVWLKETDKVELAKVKESVREKRKRAMESRIHSIYDWNGLIRPHIFIMKHLMFSDLLPVSISKKIKKHLDFFMKYLNDYDRKDDVLYYVKKGGGDHPFSCSFINDIGVFDCGVFDHSFGLEGFGIEKEIEYSIMEKRSVYENIKKELMKLGAKDYKKLVELINLYFFASASGTFRIDMIPADSWPCMQCGTYMGLDPDNRGCGEPLGGCTGGCGNNGCLFCFRGTVNLSSLMGEGARVVINGLWPEGCLAHQDGRKVRCGEMIGCLKAIEKQKGICIPSGVRGNKLKESLEHYRSGVLEHIGEFSDTYLPSFSENAKRRILMWLHNASVPVMSQPELKDDEIVGATY